jgi:hypothetical protein
MWGLDHTTFERMRPRRSCPQRKWLEGVESELVLEHRHLLKLGAHALRVATVSSSEEMPETSNYWSESRQSGTDQQREVLKALKG